MTKNIYWTLSGNIRDKKFEDLKIFLDIILKKTRTEIGCLNYEFWFSEDNKKLYVFERYTDSNSCLAHISNIRKYLPTYFECVDLDPIVILGDVTVGIREIFDTMNASYTNFFKGHTSQK